MPIQRIAVRIPKVLNTLLLDLYPNAAAAYSLRKLRNTYTGNAIRVRRSSDNTEQNIGFVGNDLDTASLLDFVGYNLWTYSEEFNNAVWIKSNLNTTGTPAYVNVETAPDSTLTGDKVIENTASDLHGFFRVSPTLVIGTTYNLSVYLKQGGRTKVRILSSVAAANQRCDVDLTNGTISNNTFANTPVVTSEANGWYRFSISITATVTTTSDFFTLRLFNASNLISYTGDGTSGAYVWGFQLSQTSTVKPYQKTVATAGCNGFVTTWYDQSGNANNANQSTAGLQPTIVESGVLFTINSKPSIKFNDQFSHNLRLNSTIATGISSYNSFVGKRATSNKALIGLAGDSSPSALYILTLFHDNKYYLQSKSTHYQVSTAIDMTTSQLLLTGVNNTGTVSMYKNGSIITSSQLNATYTPSINNIGKYTNISTNNALQEIVFYNSEQSTNRTGIESNINSFYNIY